jgi:hypothetical protein
MYIHVALTCSVEKQHGLKHRHEAPTCSKDMQ